MIHIDLKEGMVRCDGADGDGRHAIGSPEAFFAKYAEQLADAPADRDAIRNQKAGITHLDYDWNLNGTPPRRYVVRTGAGTPGAEWRNRCGARWTARPCSVGSTPRSKRCDASVTSP